MRRKHTIVIMSLVCDFMWRQIVVDSSIIPTERPTIKSIPIHRSPGTGKKMRMHREGKLNIKKNGRSVIAVVLDRLMRLLARGASFECQNTHAWIRVTEKKNQGDSTTMSHTSVTNAHNESYLRLAKRQEIKQRSSPQVGDNAPPRGP